MLRRRHLVAGLAVAPAVIRTARAATVLRWATVMNSNHPQVAMMNAIAREVAEETGGAIAIQVFPDGQLGGSRDVVEATSTGAIQLVDEGAAQFGQFVPAFSILEAPYIWKDPAHIRRGLKTPAFAAMNATLVSQRQMRVLGSTYYGTRHVTSGRREVRKVGDMQGFKLRIPEVDTYVTMAEAWGARPTPLNIGELYLALSQGAVDGEENPLPTIQSTKFYEVQKYLVLTAHILTPRLIAINEPVWRKLDAKQQGVLQAAIARHTPEQDAAIVGQESTLSGTLTKEGMTVIEVDRAAFAKPVLAILPGKFEAKWGKGLWDKIAGA